MLKTRRHSNLTWACSLLLMLVLATPGPWAAGSAGSEPLLENEPGPDVGLPWPTFAGTTLSDPVVEGLVEAGDTLFSWSRCDVDGLPFGIDGCVALDVLRNDGSLELESNVLVDTPCGQEADVCYGGYLAVTRFAVQIDVTSVEPLELQLNGTLRVTKRVDGVPRLKDSIFLEGDVHVSSSRREVSYRIYDGGGNLLDQGGHAAIAEGSLSCAGQAEWVDYGIRSIGGAASIAAGLYVGVAAGLVCTGGGPLVAASAACFAGAAVFVAGAMYAISTHVAEGAGMLYEDLCEAYLEPPTEDDFLLEIERMLVAERVTEDGTPEQEEECPFGMVELPAEEYWTTVYEPTCGGMVPAHCERTTECFFTGTRDAEGECGAECDVTDVCSHGTCE